MSGFSYPALMALANISAFLEDGPDRLELDTGVIPLARWSSADHRFSVLVCLSDGSVTIQHYAEDWSTYKQTVFLIAGYCTVAGLTFRLEEFIARTVDPVHEMPERMQ